ncbi:hypothetical protein [Tellurirhabdus bombi]|uniref:hypothetical protein n=1 Tax=Tellurirhabdus bombi TaxID=2907205 RepID=UPI001F30D45B|nr:hypothetical protein [Tellurirhabdus bombi]
MTAITITCIVLSLIIAIILTTAVVDMEHVNGRRFVLGVALLLLLNAINQIILIYR